MLLKVNQLSVSTNSSKPLTILNDISFSTENNSVFSITGRNGSGKTTLIKAITGLIDKKTYLVSGDVFIDDNRLSSVNEEQLIDLRRHKIKYVFQDSLNSFNPLLKIGYYFNKLPGEDSTTDELLEYFYLPTANKLFKFYPYELSGGMAQRTAIVLALRARPSMLILDEPTSALDSPAVNLLVHKIREFISTEKNTVIVVTQDMDFAYEISSAISHLAKGMLTSPRPVIEFQREYEKQLNNFHPENSFSSPDKT